MRGSEKGKHFIRLRQNADDPGHRARISFLLPKKEKPFAFDSFTISAIARMEEKRNGDFYLLQLQNVRLGMRGGKPYVFVASKKKSFHLFADMKKAEFIPGEWSHIHLSVNRNGDLALYVNGEAVTSCDISDRKEENWMPDSVVRILAYNQKADADNPIANMDVMRIKVKSGLMSTAQIREEAGQWLSE